VASVQGAGQSGTVVAEWVPVRLDRGLEIKIQSLSGIPSSTEFLQGFAELVWAHFDAAWVSMGDVTLERPRSNTLTVLVYVRHRIRSLEVFLDSLNKNSVIDGHTVMLVADPEWGSPIPVQHRDPGTDEHRSLAEWFEATRGRYSRLDLQVIDNWTARTFFDSERTQEVYDAFRGVNIAARRVKTSHMVVGAPESVYWPPAWDFNLKKWIGLADMIFPRYVEPHCDPEPAVSQGSSRGCWDRLDIGPEVVTEGDLLEQVFRHSYQPGRGIVESPAHRAWSYTLGVVLAPETFQRLGCYPENPMREPWVTIPPNGDFDFDDDAQHRATKLVAFDVPLLRTRYVFRRIQWGGVHDRERWMCPERRGVRRGPLEAEMAGLYAGFEEAGASC